MADLFIAHAPEDEASAAAIAQAFKARGFEVALRSEPAKAVLALWSSGALANEAVRREAMRARERGVLIGARLERAEVPEDLGPVSVDLTAWRRGEDNDALERLMREAAALRDRPAEPVRARRDSLLGRILLFGAGAIVLAALASFAVTPLLRPKAPAPQEEIPVESAGDEEAPPTEGTDSPGAADMYGLTEEEIRAREPRQLIQLALERTAIETIEAEAARGDALGLSLLCLAQTFGEGLSRDAPSARRSCSDAAAGGDALATYMLSSFARGSDAAEADRLLARAAEAEDPRAQTELAQAHLAAGRTSEALALAQRAAAQGYAPALALVGAMQQSRLGPG